MTRPLWSFRLRLLGLVAVALAMPPLPEAGTIEWAKAVNKVLAEIQDANPGQLVDGSEKLLALYGKCTGCRQQAYASRDDRLERLGERPLLHQVQEAEFSEDPVSLSRLYLETGRAEAARDLATRELRRTRFLERRLDLMEVLAGAEHDLGHQKASRKLTRQLLQETPVSSRYCDKALHWMTWLGEDPVIDPTSFMPRDIVTRVEELRRLEQRRGDDAYVGCAMFHALVRWDWFIASSKQVNVSVDPDVLALFPEGIDQPLEDLARRTSDPSARASILLEAARRWITRSDRPRLAGLIEEALRAGPARNIQAGVLVQELYNLPFDQEREREALVQRLIDRFPDSETAVAGCVEFWGILNSPRSDFSSLVPEWKTSCSSLFQRGPNLVRRWQNLIMYTPRDSGRAVEAIPILQAMHPPDEVAPAILLRLSAALREENPEKAWELERLAIHHPQFPGLGHSQDPRIGDFFYWSLFSIPESMKRAEDHDDQETAEFLKELFDRRPGGVRIKL